MKRLFALLLSFSLLFQNVAPAMVFAQEVLQEEVSSSPEPSAEPEDSEEESTEISESTEEEQQDPQVDESPTPEPEIDTEEQDAENDSPSPSPTPTSPPVEEIQQDNELVTSPSPIPTTENATEATESAELKTPTTGSPEPLAATSPTSESSGSSGSSGSSTTSTGGAAAISSTTNAANNTNAGSNVQLMTENLTGQGDADLNELWCENPEPQQSSVVAPSPSPSEESSEVATESGTLHDALILNNEATVESSITVEADTGNNEVVTDGDGTILTGDAVAIVNLINLLNSTFIDSQLMIAMLNVWPEFAGDIVLPRPELVLGQEYVDQDGNTVQFTAEQWAEILNILSVQASTGNNTATAAGELNALTTGDAYAAANVSSFANLLLQQQGKYGLWVNVAADWNGSILGAEGQDMQLARGLYFFDFGSILGMQTPCGTLGDSPCLPDSLGLQNSASVVNDIQVTASTGGNTVDAQGNAIIHTGNATAIANVFNMVNTTFLQSQMFFGFVNILGDWTGNIWFAYPDVGVQITADKDAVQLGDTITYTVNYKNGGKDAADDVEIQFDLPEGTRYLSDTLGTGAEGLKVGTLQPGEGGSFQVTVQVTDWNALVPSSTQAGVLSWLIPTAYADSDQRELSAKVRILTSEPQSSTRNDQSVYRTAVYREIEDLEGVGGLSDEELDLYEIQLQMEHNVGEYVYPGDVVTFTARIRNRNSVDLKNVALMHQVLDQNGNVLAELAFPIGKVGAGKGGLITFGMQVPNGQLLEDVTIQTRTWVTGTADDGSPAESGISGDQFLVRARALALPRTSIPLPEVVGSVEAGNGEILGAVSDSTAANSKGVELWQILTIMLFVLLTVRMMRLLDKRQGLHLNSHL